MNDTSARDSDLDAAKGILMILVVFGHLLDQVVWLPSGGMDEACGWVYWIVYLFHMPAFAFVSGWFGCRSDVWRGVRRYSYLYVIWQLFYTVFFLMTDGIGSFNGIGFTKPVSHMWYLVSIALWRIILEVVRPAFKKCPAVCVMVSVAVGMFIGMDFYAGGVLSWSRTVVLLPFYLAGAGFRDFGWHPVRIMMGLGRRRHFLLAGGLVLSILFVGCFGSMPLIPTSVLYYDRPYVVIDWVLPRGCMYIVASLMTAGLFALIPMMQGFVRKIGAMSLNVYLVHMVPVKLLGKLYAMLFPNGVPYIMLPFVAAVFTVPVALLCISRGVMKLTLCMTTPPWERVRHGNDSKLGKEA